MSGERWTYRQLDEEIARLAGYLKSQDVRPGDRVAIAMPNCYEFYVAYWATLHVGAIVAPVNFRLGAKELNYVFNNIAPKIVFVHRETWPQVAPILKELSEQPIVIGVGIQSILSFDETLQSAKVEAVQIDTNDLAIIAHTSGTTGVPKGAMMRHSDLLFNIKNTVIPFSWRHEDVNLLLSPLFHVVALYSIVPSSVYLGATIVVAPKPNPREVVDLIESERVTNFLSVPTFHQMVAALPDIEARDLSCLRMIGYSGSPMPVRAINAWHSFSARATAQLFRLDPKTFHSHILHAIRRGCFTCRFDRKNLARSRNEILAPDGTECNFGESGILRIDRENTIRGYWNRRIYRRIANC